MAGVSVNDLQKLNNLCEKQNGNHSREGDVRFQNFHSFVVSPVKPILDPSH